ncbi:SDR family NAD(P)-dependent oxidoreductase [Candidatus Woesearchaeota archaeon]|nr:SDR family NAD(P)-dependent oxidoreductase [Candidatus Woesearchaeota archaeon]
MNILVTGGAGFIGSFLTDKLIEKGHTVRIFDNLDPQVHLKGNPPNYLNKGAEFIKGDIRNKEELEKALKGIDAIYHMAAKVGIAQSNYEVEEFIDVNCRGTANLFNLIINNKLKMKKIFIPGSNTSYGEGMYHCKACDEDFHAEVRPVAQLEKKEWGVKCPGCGKDTKPVPIKEDAHLKCNSIYSITKKFQEETVMMLGKMYSIPITVMRFFNVYGARQSINNPYSGVSAIFLSRLKSDNVPLIYEDGLQTRDFVSVHDVIDAALLSLTDKKTDYEIFNIGSRNPVSMCDLAAILAKHLKKDIKPMISGKFRKGDIRNCYGDISKAEKVLGYRPKVSFEEGIKEAIGWSETEESVDKFDKADKELKEKGLV